MLKVAAVSASVASLDEDGREDSASVDVGDDDEVPVESFASATALALRAASFSSAYFFSRSYSIRSETFR